jgi:hypothetical protein
MHWEQVFWEGIKTVFSGAWTAIEGVLDLAFTAIAKVIGSIVLAIYDNGLLPVYNWLKDKFNSLQVVNLEDPTFENQFEVYSNDQIEARYLLTTTFMERLLSLSSMFDNKIKCSFYNKKLLFMIDRGQDTFKTSSIFMPSTFVYDIKNILIEMSMLFQIIDTLKLSEKTGL